MDVLKDAVLLPGFTDSLGRVYDRSELEAQITNKKLHGELGIGNGLLVNLANVSHSVENIRITEVGVLADIHILDTPSGKIVKSLLTAGIKFKTSIRASGKVDSDNRVTELTVIAFDLTEG